MSHFSLVALLHSRHFSTFEMKRESKWCHLSIFQFQICVTLISSHPQDIFQTRFLLFDLLHAKLATVKTVAEVKYNIPQDKLKFLSVRPVHHGI